MTTTTNNLKNFYWDQTTASYLITGECESAIRRHKKREEVFDVLCELTDPEGTGIDCGNEGFAFNFDFIPANLVADVIDDLVDGKEINPLNVFRKLDAIDETEDCETDERLSIQTIH